MDLVSVPGVAGPNLAPRITFSYAPVNMQALADGTHVGRDAGHAGHSHGHAHGAHGHSHGAHGHSHAHTASHQIPGPGMPSHQTHAHQQPPSAHSHSHGQEHTSAAASGEYVCHSSNGKAFRWSREGSMGIKSPFPTLSCFYGLDMWKAAELRSKYGLLVY